MTVYRISEVVGTSGTSVSDAIRGALERIEASGEDASWFEVKEIRGRLDDGSPEYQVKVEFGALMRLTGEEELRDAAKTGGKRPTTRQTRSATAQVAAKKGQKGRSDLARGFEKQGRSK